MSNEMLQKTIDLVSSLEAKNETQQIAKYELIEYTERLHKENQELKKQLEVGKEQYNDLVEEKENLQEQLDYLRGGEYLNQLRFERNMLQHVVDNNEVSKEDKEFIDMTHRNTELLEENQELKKQYCERTDCSGRIKDSKQYDSLVQRVDNQQKEFIEWLENKIKYWEEQEQQWLNLGFMKFGGEANNKIIFKKILSKYKEIIGGKDE